MKSIDMVTLREPKSPISEAYRTLRTNIRFASFEKDIRVISITSPWMNEGKSTITANLAVTIAQSGSRILLIDGDLRNPTVHKIFSVPNNTGLTNILMENKPYKDYVTHIEIENIDIMLCGPKPPNPSELLGSSKMKSLIQSLKDEYDYILIDTPPVTAVTDAALISSASDGVLLVISSGETIIENALKAKELLLNVNANILGIVLNKAKNNRSREFYNSKYYYYGDFNKSKKPGKRNRSKRGMTHV